MQSAGQTNLSQLSADWLMTPPIPLLFVQMSQCLLQPPKLAGTIRPVTLTVSCWPSCLSLLRNHSFVWCWCVYTSMFKEYENTSLHKRKIAFILKVYNFGFVDPFSLISGVTRWSKWSCKEHVFEKRKWILRSAFCMFEPNSRFQPGLWLMTDLKYLHLYEDGVGPTVPNIHAAEKSHKLLYHRGCTLLIILGRKSWTRPIAQPSTSAPAGTLLLCKPHCSLHLLRRLHTGRALFILETH